MWTEEWVRQRRADLEREAAQDRLASQARQERIRGPRLRARLAASLHRAADWMEPATLAPARRRKPG